MMFQQEYYWAESQKNQPKDPIYLVLKHCPVPLAEDDKISKSNASTLTRSETVLM